MSGLANSYDPYVVVRDFEMAVAEFAGAKYGVSTDSCTSAIFLSLLWSKKQNPSMQFVEVPKRTYPSVPMAAIHAGLLIKWVELYWFGSYHIYPADVIDGAKRFRRGMYAERVAVLRPLYCLSFHVKKLLPIGRGGMVLTDDEEAAKWLRRMRFDGREECSLSQQKSFDMIGYNCYLTPEQAARGLQLLDLVPKNGFPDQVEDPPYPDLSLHSAFAPYTVEQP